MTIKIKALNCYEGPEGLYYNPEDNFLFALQNKKFKIGLFNGEVVTTEVYDVVTKDGINREVTLPQISPVVDYIGDL